jgi:hypothetical protein
MSNQWFRLYSEVLNDPKVQKLSGDLFKIWVNILCVACTNNGTLPSLEDVSFALRIPFHETKTAFQELEKFGLLVTVDETFQIYNWGKRQYKSDASTDRVRRHRKQNRNVSETPPETEQNRDRTEQKESKSRGSRFALDHLSPEWESFCRSERPDLDPGETFKLFTDYWRAMPGQKGVKTDWDGTWRNWVRRENGKTIRNNAGDYAKPTKDDRARAAVMRAAERLGFADGQRGEETVSG